jgi:endonuclease YncB( thermonuclease family)
VLRCVVALLAGMVVASGCGGGERPRSRRFDAAIDHVVDGDTIWVATRGLPAPLARVDSAAPSRPSGQGSAASPLEKVRLIGIDTPEVHNPNTPIECFGRAATRRMERLLPAGAAVRLVLDVEKRDRYGRLLAYVYRRRDGLFVNAALVREGYAVAYTVPPDVEHADEFVRLTRQARDHDRGLWHACGGPDTPARAIRRGPRQAG